LLIPFRLFLAFITQTTEIVAGVIDYQHSCEQMIKRLESHVLLIEKTKNKTNSVACVR
jgi:hypothetical protein